MMCLISWSKETVWKNTLHFSTVFKRKSVLAYVVSTKDVSIGNTDDVTPGDDYLRRSREEPGCESGSAQCHTSGIRGTSTEVERIRAQIDPGGRCVNCSRTVWNGNTFTHKEGNAPEMNRRMQKGTPATERFLVTKTTV